MIYKFNLYNIVFFLKELNIKYLIIKLIFIYLSHFVLFYFPAFAFKIAINRIVKEIETSIPTPEVKRHTPTV
jgi:hypothetical protein